MIILPNMCSNVSCKNEATNFIHLNTNELRKSCQLHILGMLQMNRDSFEISKEDFEHLLNNCKHLFKKMNLIKIHYCGYASQPYVDIYCTGETHYVNGFSNISKVYMADGDENDHSPVYYTFDLRLVTCENCLTKKGS